MLNKKNIVDQILHQKKTADPLEKAKAFAPVNIALIKYWGKRDAVLNLPLTNSLSIALPHLGTHTTISYEKNIGQDQIFLNGTLQNPEEIFSKKISEFLDLFRPLPETHYYIETKNDIPTAAGLASSASGFAALVLALNQFYGWELSKTELSILCRLGSGSACRSLWNGLVEWHAGTREDGMDSFAEPLDIEWPELKIGLLLISSEKKSIGSREAMNRTVHTVPRFKTDWQKQVESDLKNVKIALAKKDFELLGHTAEQNALAMHALMKEASPSIDYCLPETLLAREKIWNLRKQGVPVFFTQDAGPNLKILFLEKDRALIGRDFSGI